MPSIELITYKNSFYEGFFSKSEFNIEMTALPLAEDEKLNRKSDFIMVELRNDKIEEGRKIIEKAFNNGIVICIAEDPGKELKKMLLKQGIAYLITENDPKKIYLFIKAIEEKNKSSAGKIVVFDTKISSKTLLNDIITRFGYEPYYVSTIDELFDSLKHSNIQMNLLNLGAENLDLNDLIRRSYFRTELKRIPLVAFKDMDDGIFIHEFTSGLNKLTRIVLSIEELMSFLIDIFFRKEVMPLVKEINSLYHYDDKSFYTDESLSQVYYSDEENIFSMEDIFNNDNIEKIHSSMNALKKSSAKLTGLKWLKISTS